MTSPATVSQRDPFAGAEAQDVLQVRLASGEAYEGSYLTQAGMHFLHVRDRASLHGTVVGPFAAEEVASVAVVRAWVDIKADRFDASRGERFPGPLPVTAADFEYRLQRLARAIAQEVGPRRDQLIRQFDDCADVVCLSAAKRTWVRAEGSWSLKNNAPPTMADLWIADVASPSFLKRPKPTDFDPDPAVRRRRQPLPADVLADVDSVPAVLSRLKRAGLKARISLAGDPVWSRAVIQVDLAPGRTGRFDLRASRIDGVTSWALRWGGNWNGAGLTFRRRAARLPAYQALLEALPVTTRGSR